MFEGAHAKRGCRFLSWGEDSSGGVPKRNECSGSSEFWWDRDTSSKQAGFCSVCESLIELRVVHWASSEVACTHRASCF
jgi:hypothetical protein